MLFRRHDYEYRRLLTVGGQGDDQNNTDTNAGGGGGGEEGSPFDRALDNFEQRTSLPEPPQQDDGTLPSDPRNKRTQPGTTDPNQTRTTQTPAPQAPTQTGQTQTGQTPGQPAQPGRAPFLRADAQGNLIDANNQIVAKAGGERKYYQAWRGEQRVVEQHAGRIRELEAENNAYRTSAQAIQAMGLQPDEMSAAANIMSNWKKPGGPVEVIRYLLTQAQAMGHDVNTLFGGQPAGVDMGAIRQMINDAVAPLTGAQRDQQATDEARAAGDAQYSEFVTEFPDALTHADVIADMLQKAPNVTPREAYFRLQAFAATNGLDWNQPLRAQMEARQNANGGGSQTPSQPARTVPQQRSPLPGGNPPPGQMTSARPTNGTGNSLVSTNRDLVAQAMIDAGLPDPRM